jgi:hypothetical protein
MDMGKGLAEGQNRSFGDGEPSVFQALTEPL